jgi:fucose 4-O-acetylase-like acetyltransferase
MFLSGFVAQWGKPVNFFGSVRQKFSSLVVPFLAWAIVSYFVNSFSMTYNIFEYLVLLGKSPDFGLWFLWILFLNYLVLSLILLFKRIPVEWSIVGGAILIKALPIYTLGFGLLKWHFPFFAIGYLVSKHRDKVKAFAVPLGVIALVVYPLLFMSWNRTSGPTFLPELQMLLVSNHMEYLLNLILIIYYNLVDLTGIILVYFFVTALKPLRIYQLLSWLGTVTLDIYVSHQFFLFSLTQGVIGILLKAIVALVLSLGLSFGLLRRVPLLSKLFLGKRVLFPPREVSGRLTT